MNQLRVRLLGPPRIERAGQILEVDMRKATAMLAYLALSGERLSRDWLTAFLSLESDDRRAKAALRRTLSSLKSAVGAEAIFASWEAIGVEADVAWCDVMAFKQALQQGDLADAVKLYRDEFMAGFSLRDSLPFDDWQLQRQESLRRDLSQALDHSHKPAAPVDVKAGWTGRVGWPKSHYSFAFSRRLVGFSQTDSCSGWMVS